MYFIKFTVQSQNRIVSAETIGGNTVFIYLGKSMFLATISCQFKVIVSFKNIPEQNCSVLVPRLNSKSVKDIQMLRKVAQMTTILTIKSSFI